MSHLVTVVVGPATFAPTVTLVGGAGNVVPVYATNTGRYTRVGNLVFVDVYLTGDGGDEGAGSGILNIALPIAASASHPTGHFPAGHYINNAGKMNCNGQIAGGATTIQLQDGMYADMDGADQSGADRMIRLKFAYEV